MERPIEPSRGPRSAVPRAGGSAGLSRLLRRALVAGALAAPLASPVQAGGGEADAPADETPTGHERMVALLAELREGTSDHPYVGTDIVGGLESRLEAMAHRSTHPRALRLRLRLGGEYQRVGRTREAIDTIREALELARSAGDALGPQELAEAEYQLAVAYMRLGEDMNCCLANNSDSCIMPIEGGGVHDDRYASRNAVRVLERVLGTAPEGSELAIEARWLLNLAYMTLADYPEGVPEAYRIEPEVFASDEDFPRFVDVAPLTGLDRQELSGGLVVDDLDGDGRLDVLTSTWAVTGLVRFYHNDGKGRFVERTSEANLDGVLGGLNMASGDYDGDGDVDVLVIRGSWARQHGHFPNSLLRNDGEGVFEDVTYEAGLGESVYPTLSAKFADYDNDGDLDLYVGNQTDPKNRCPGELYRNDGDGTFTDVAAEAGVTNDRFAAGVAWGDYDSDGHVDLFIGNISGPNRLYRNRGDGTFEDVATELGLEQPSSAFASWFFDYDNDGDLDLWVSSYGEIGDRPSLATVAASYLGLPSRGEPMRLYENDGKGGFTDVAEERGLELFTLPMGANYGDMDGDGWLDVYLGTGYPAYDCLIPNVMYRNRGGKGFADVTTAGGFGNLQKGHGAGFADVDDDGDVDVLMRMGGAYPGDVYRCLLYENPGFESHWIEVGLVGTRSNRLGVGAHLRIDVEVEGKRRSIHRTAGTGGSFGCSPHRQRIGLGRAERVERLEIRWPATGERQVLEDLEVDRAIVVEEGREGFTLRALQPFALAGK